MLWNRLYIIKSYIRASLWLMPFFAVLAFVEGILLVGCAGRPKDDAQLSELKFENLMGSRYTEILLVFGDALTRNYTAGVFNTTGLNGASSCNRGM